MSRSYGLGNILKISKRQTLEIRVFRLKSHTPYISQWAKSKSVKDTYIKAPVVNTSNTTRGKVSNRH